MESGPERRIRSANLDYDIFKSIYVAFYPRLKTYAEKYVDAEEAGDIVQDAFLYVWSRKEELQYGERFFNYMLKSVHNACMNAVKRHYLERGKAEDHIRLMKARYSETSLDQISRYIYDNEIYNTIESAVSALPPRCAEIFRLSYYNRLKAKEIAFSMNISVRTVEAQIYKALKLFIARLKQFCEEKIY